MRSKQRKAKTSGLGAKSATDINLNGLLQSAHSYVQTGRMQSAERVYRQILAQDSNQPDALFGMGVIAHQAGNNAGAEEYTRKAIQFRPGDATLHFNLGIILRSQGKTNASEACFRKAIKIKPDYAAALANLANLFHEQKKMGEAITYYRKAIHIQPNHLIAHLALGNALWQRGELETAAQHFKTATHLKPDFAEAYENLGTCLWALNRDEDAIKSYLNALKINPHYARAYSNLGAVYYKQGKREDAIRAFESAVREFETQPASALEKTQAYKNLGNAYHDQGDYEQAIESYRKEQSIIDSDSVKLRIALTYPTVLESSSQIDEVRNRLGDNLDSLLNQDLAITDPVNEVGLTNFLLCYHGRDDKELQTKLEQVYELACPNLRYTAPHCVSYQTKPESEKIKIGFISKFFKEHSIGKTSKGLIAHLPRDIFTVTAFFMSPPSDETGQFISSHADKSVILPAKLEGAQRKIADETLDILFYQDIGMDPFTYYLAFARLAPMQCTYFGHPVTTGISTVDYFISTDYFEPSESEKHYSEKLIKFSAVGSPAYCYKPEIPAQWKPRSYFGLDENQHIYICPQTLFKFHPEFDAILGEILRADPSGLLVLKHGKHPYWSELLKNRLRRSIPDVVDRITFLGNLQGTDYINLIAVSDVMLDTIHFCGFTTTLEALAVGTPVVTLPGEFMRSRHSMSLYKRMTVTDCIAENEHDYINIALRLGTDPDYRDTISRKIIQNLGAVWGEQDVISQFEAFFVNAYSSINKQLS